jgi:hypothetical protein
MSVRVLGESERLSGGIRKIRHMRFEQIDEDLLLRSPTQHQNIRVLRVILATPR